MAILVVTSPPLSRAWLWPEAVAEFTRSRECRTRTMTPWPAKKTKYDIPVERAISTSGYLPTGRGDERLLLVPAELPEWADLELSNLRSGSKQTCQFGNNIEIKLKVKLDLVIKIYTYFLNVCPLGRFFKSSLLPTRVRGKSKSVRSIFWPQLEKNSQLW